MAKKQKYYVVWEGHTPGIYESWHACKEQIEGYSGAKYKSFPTRQAAETAFYQNYEEVVTSKLKISGELPSEVVVPSISVDGACSGNPGVTEYQGVDTKTGNRIFHGGPFDGGSNNLGEFLALVHAISLLKKQGNDTMPIYTDSRTAMAWLRNKKVKTNITRSHKNKTIFTLIDRAEKWIQTNRWKNPIMKWDTSNWGEIPADFGRK